MSVTKEELAALILGGPEVVKHAIDDRRKLRDQMVGQLYPSILADEIAHLQLVYAGMTTVEERGRQ